MKISLITAVFNRKATLAEAIASAEAQTHQDVEHVIQDGASKDGSLDLILSLQTDRMRIVSERDQGLYDALNRAITRSTGDVVGFLHSDDVLANSNVLSRVAEALEDQRFDGVYGDLDYVAEDDPNRVIRRWRSGNYRRERLAWGWMPPHPTLFLRKSVYERFGLYDTSLRIAADYEAMLRYLVKGELRLSYIPEVMVKMRVGGVSNGSFRSIIAKSTEDLVAIRRHHVGGIATLAAKNIRKINQFLPLGR